MKATLYFYKTPVNLIDKNFVLDSIETYLSTLTPVVKSDFQYQRFELEKTIKVNMNQEYQLNIASLTKYNYLKITTLDSTQTNTAVYYYFIKSARQVSESTIEFSIVMDVLNTYKFSLTASNDSYTLSNKSLIKREHKDRLKKLPTQFITRDISAEELYAINQIESVNNYQNTEDEVSNLVINTEGIKRFMTDESIITFEIVFETINGAYLQHNENKYFNCKRMLFGDFGGNYNLSLYDTDSTLILSLNITEFIENLVLVIPPDGGFASDFRGGSYDWTEFVYLMYLYNASVDIIDNKYQRIIDYFQEGLSTQLFKKREETLYDEDGENQWYVIYSSANAVVVNPTDSSSKYVNPVEMRFYSDNGYSISTISAHEVTLNATSPLIPKWVNTTEEIRYTQQTPSTLGEKYVKIGGNTYDFHDYKEVHLRRDGNNDITFKKVFLTDYNDVLTTFDNVSSVTFYGINTLQCDGYWGNHTTIQINSGASSYTGTADSWKQLDLTDSKFIKAFAFPYSPCDFLIGKTAFTELPQEFSFNADNYIQLNNIQGYEFKYQKKFNVASPLSNINILGIEIGRGQARNIEAESKLFHSDYYQPKFVYDSFSFSFLLEQVNADNLNENYLTLDNEFYVTYIVSRNIQSKFAFIFNEYTLTRAFQDYDNVLTIERNNEKALYNNAYINYVRSGGYSYDTKKASSQNAVNGITTALSIVGAVGSFASSGATGGMGVAGGIALSISAVTGIMRSIHTAQEQDRAISQKINQAVMQGTSVQGSEDIDILTAFSGNKAKLVYYELSERMKNAMWDLFHYCGYATNEQKIPNVKTRLYFNFVQAEIILKDFTFNEEIARRITEKWNQGITFMHWVNNAYDFNQEYENFETSLL